MTKFPLYIFAVAGLLQIPTGTRAQTMLSTPVRPHPAKALSRQASDFTTTLAKPITVKPRLAEVSSDVPVIYGNLIYRSDWAQYLGGIYSIAASEGASPVCIDQNILYANGGGAWVPDENVYVAGAYVSTPVYPLMDPTIVVYDSETWEMLEQVSCDASQMAWEMCYNPADGKIYGSFAGDDYLSTAFFGTLDYKNITTERITDLPRPYIALAADGNGVMYGIEQTSGDLYRIQRDGTREKVGSTGLNPVYFQSATIDYSTGKFYWMACMEDSSTLYTVNLETAEVTPVAQYPLLDEWVGIYTRAIYAPAGAPGEVTGLQLDFPADATSGSVSFTMPSRCNDGEALVDGTYNVYVNDNLKAEGKAAAGEKVTVSLTVPEGMVSLPSKQSTVKGMARAPS